MPCSGAVAGNDRSGAIGRRRFDVQRIPGAYGGSAFGKPRDRLYSMGVMPTVFLKAVQKWGADA